MANTKKYKLIGRSHSGFEDDGKTRKEYKTDDMVPLTEDQFESFKDKFENKQVESVESPTKPESNVNPDVKNIQPAPGTQTKSV